MEPVSNAIVYIVDDDAGVREALAWLLRSRRLLSESFDSAEAFDAMLKAKPHRADPAVCCWMCACPA
jgi:two-component system response regulator DctR